jgi:CheY-like chemotaxis protein
MAFQGQGLTGRRAPSMMGRVPARILIVDDEPAVLRLLRLALEGTAAGWTIETVATAEEALARPREPPFDLYIVDKNLPGVSGIALLREIRKRGEEAGAILITGFASSASARDAMNLGVDAYLEKPFPNVFEVANVVRRSLEAAERRRRVAAALSPRKEAGFTRLRILLAFRSPVARAQAAGLLDERDEVVQAGTKKELLDALAQRADLLLVDGSGNVAELMADVRGVARSLPCVVVGERLALPVIRRLIELEVRSFVEGPLDGAEGRKRLAEAIDRYRGRKLIQELNQ